MIPDDDMQDITGFDTVDLRRLQKRGDVFGDLLIAQRFLLPHQTRCDGKNLGGCHDSIGFV
jgi:hypothetical protein